MRKSVNHQRRLLSRLAPAFILTAGLLLGACDDTDGVDFDEPALGCNPAGESVDCFFPFPTDAFLVQDEGSRAIAFTEDSMPAYRSGKLRFDLNEPIDGYAIHTPIFATLGQPIDASQLIFHTDEPTPTTQPDSHTLVLDAETGEAIPHFAELDAAGGATGQELLQIRLYSNLEADRRYIVAIQGLKTPSGETIARPESFEHLAFTEGYPYFAEAQANTRANILPVLETFGVDLENLQLAWDFTTRTDASAQNEVLQMMDKTREWLDGLSGGPDFEITSVIDHVPGSPDAHNQLRYTIHGELTIPLFLEDETPSAVLRRDANGSPELHGNGVISARILIPHSVVANGSAKTAIQFGHGFFGSTEEMSTSFLPGFLEASEAVGIGIDWWGLSSEDMSVILGKLTGSVATTFDFTERLAQSFVNQTVLARAANATFPELDVYGDYLTADAHTFYGISLGHILGSTAVAVSPEMNLAVLSVGGGSFSFIMSRARPFDALMKLVLMGMNKAHDSQRFIALASIAMEKIDPMTFAPMLLSMPSENGTIDRRVLAQVGEGDPAVPVLSSYAWARAAGLPIGPSIATVPLLPDATLPSTDSAIFSFDFQLEGELPGFYSRFPEADNGVHQAVREDARGQDQIRAFIFDGEITDVCSGPCTRPL